MKTLLLAALLFITFNQAMAFEVTGLGKNLSSIPSIDCNDLKLEAEEEAKLDSVKKAEAVCNGSGVVQKSKYLMKGSCYTSGVFQSITNYHASAQAEFECVGPQKNSCNEDEVLVCIPSQPCRNSSIGCNEAPRPEPTCFCGRKPN